ncbi:hypothetical protein UFOVP270_18 [uncultured Caudovirales phage]|uniref:Uncharacterized protein n=1 Tax=uncultured Caudovirales phage TaxID=2100421 RepID=A0A6J5L9I2_9CAUD|nr:hypothetical protein UFOVP101_38 [uncultured Caudovirales phage]CAB4134114.1 hypothetical protein UFOVP270_18 [uncultured Caudovirales phage]
MSKETTEEEVLEIIQKSAQSFKDKAINNIPSMELSLACICITYGFFESCNSKKKNEEYSMEDFTKAIDYQYRMYESVCTLFKIIPKSLEHIMFEYSPGSILGQENVIS